MTISQLIELAEKRLAYLAFHRSAAASIGDVEAISRFDAEITTTEQTLASLRSIA
jgi:hypothetical protein